MKAKILKVLLVIGVVLTGTQAMGAFTHCKVTGVAIYKQRMHVRCAVPVSGIKYFAVSTSANGQFFRSTVAIANSAMVTGRIAQIMYSPGDTSGASIGCQANDCRLILGLEML